MGIVFLVMGNGAFMRAFLLRLIHEAGYRKCAAVFQRKADWRTDVFGEQGYYHVVRRGRLNGLRIRDVLKIESVSEMRAMLDDFKRYIEIFKSKDLQYIITNLGERGWDWNPHDPVPKANGTTMPASSLEQLLVGLRVAFDSGSEGFIILPLELELLNGTRLDLHLSEIGMNWATRAPKEWGRFAQDLLPWMRNKCIFRTTLVDQLVPGSAPSDDAALNGDQMPVLAEPFARLYSSTRNSMHPFLPNHIPLVDGVQEVCNVEWVYPYAIRKIGILNASHTAGVSWAFNAGNYQGQGDARFHELMLDHTARSWIEKLVYDELIPAMPPFVPDAREFADAVIERYQNRHASTPLVQIWKDAETHKRKVKGRALLAYGSYREENPDLPEPSLLRQVLDWEGLEPDRI